jgi:hypothetical protein
MLSLYKASRPANIVTKNIYRRKPESEEPHSDVLLYDSE